MLQHLTLALPQIIILATACLCLLSDLCLSKQGLRFTYAIALFGLLVAGIFSAAGVGSASIVFLARQCISDDLSHIMNTGIALAVLVTLVYAKNYLFERQMPVGDILLLVLLSTFGMMVLVSANTLLTSYLGLELVSLPLYALTAVRRTEGNASEAAMKYFVMGAIASGMLLYGFSLLYGATGQTVFSEIANVIAAQNLRHDPLLQFALVFIVAGLGFKLAMVPFHMWAPDVYQGAPLPVTLFLSAAPKVAGLALWFRLLTVALPGAVAQWQLLLVVMTLLSVGLGNICAIVQTNIRRLFAYSTIAHMGFALFGILAGTEAGYASALFYMLVYMMMSLAAFGLLTLLSRDGLEIESIDDLKGLNEKNPWLAFMMMVVLFSMAGIPPTAGFFVKLSVLKALVDVHMIWVTVVAVLFAVIAAFYYLRIIKCMYFDEAKHTHRVTISAGTSALFAINCLALIYFGLFPAGLISICSRAFAG